MGQVLAGLATATVRLRAVEAAPLARWRRRSDDGWTALEILAHLRSADEVIAPRLIMVLAGERPLLPAIDDRRWQEVMGYAAMAPADLVDGFGARRLEIVAALRRRPPGDWSRIGMHEVAGAQTLLEIARHLFEHEQEHLNQIEHLLSAPGAAEAEAPWQLPGNRVLE